MINKYSSTGCSCSGGYFIGSSRTYYWLATDFYDWCKEQPSNNRFFQSDEPCIKTSLYYKECSQKAALYGGPGFGGAFGDVVLNFGEQYYTYYYHYISTKLITRAGNPVMWRDKVGKNCGTAVGCYYDCFINNNIICPGGGFGITQRFADKATEYWGTPYIPGSEIDLATTFDRDGNVTPFALSILGIKGIENPFPYEGFVYDYYAVVGQGPAILGSIFQIICTYCFGGLIPPCVDQWFSWRGFASQVYTFDNRLGIPYRITQKLEEFYNEYEDIYSDVPIKYNHMADEQIFITGSANWNNGDIGKDEKVDTKLYGDYLDNFTGSDGNFRDIQYERKEDGTRLATLTEASGGGRYLIADLFLGVDAEFTEISVLNKNCASRKNIEYYPWLYVDIPDPLQIEFQQALFTNVFPVAIEDILTRFLWGHSSTYDFFGVGVNLAVIGNSYHYRKYTKKLVKAPHNLYVKNGEFTFRETEFGKTLVDLEPGRYYFPNMCYCASSFQSLEQFDGKKLYKGNEYAQAIEENNSIFNERYNLPLIQFIDPDDNDESLEARFKNAVKLLGFPGSKKTPAARIEEASLFSKYKALEELMSEVESIREFLASDQNFPDVQILPPSDSDFYNAGNLEIIDTILD